MSNGAPPGDDLQQAATILRVEVAELVKTAMTNLERAAAADAQGVGGYVRHASRLEQQARRLDRVARWLEALAGARPAPPPARVARKG